MSTLPTHGDFLNFKPVGDLMLRRQRYGELSLTACKVAESVLPRWSGLSVQTNSMMHAVMVTQSGTGTTAEYVYMHTLANAQITADYAAWKGTSRTESRQSQQRTESGLHKSRRLDDRRLTS
jgi:hypothetical protein